MVDTLTSAVRKRAGGAAPVCTPTSLDCATHNGCPMPPCNVGKGNAKGRVDNGVGDVPKTVLAGREIPDFSALHPAARPWRDPVAPVRRHGATRETPSAVWPTERPALRPPPRHPFDRATVSQGRAARQCRLPLETNRSSVPAHDAGHALTRTPSPDRRCVSLGDQRLARHGRRYARFHDVEDPAHPTPRVEPRTKARDPTVLLRVLALAPRAEAYALTLAERQLHPPQHVRTLGALRAIDAPASVARALDEAWGDEAFASADIANRVAPRARCTPEASARPLTRRAALLEVRLAPPARSMYQATRPPPPPTTSEPEGMAARSPHQPSPTPLRTLEQPLASLKLACIAAQSAAGAPQAADQAWSPVDDLARRMEGEADGRGDRATTSRMRVARFPGRNTLDPFRGDWPTRRHRLQGHHHCRLALSQDTSTLLCLGGVGLGPPPLATALGSTAGLQGYAVLLPRAIDVLNTLAAAKSAGRLKAELKQYTKPALRILDALGSLPIDQTGADLLCPVIALRDAQGAILLPSNRAVKEWPTIFNHDRTLTAAVLDRLLHHADTISIAGKRVRMTEHIERSTVLPRARRKRMCASGDLLSPPAPLTFSNRRRPKCSPHFQRAGSPTFSRNR
jgi:DNA replication protein DnaC